MCRVRRGLQRSKGHHAPWRMQGAAVPAAIVTGHVGTYEISIKCVCSWHAAYSCEHLAKPAPAPAVCLFVMRAYSWPSVTIANDLHLLDACDRGPHSWSSAAIADDLCVLHVAVCSWCSARESPDLSQVPAAEPLCTPGPPQPAGTAASCTSTGAAPRTCHGAYCMGISGGTMRRTHGWSMPSACHVIRHAKYEVCAYSGREMPYAPSSGEPMLGAEVWCNCHVLDGWRSSIVVLQNIRIFPFPFLPLVHGCLCTYTV